MVSRSLLLTAPRLSLDPKCLSTVAKHLWRSENTTASAIQIKNIDKKPITKNFDNLKIEDDRELIIDY